MKIDWSKMHVIGADSVNDIVEIAVKGDPSGESIITLDQDLRRWIKNNEEKILNLRIEKCRLERELYELSGRMRMQS